MVYEFFKRSESECVIFIFGTSVGFAKFVSVPAEVQILVGRLYSYDCPCGLQSIIIIIIIISTTHRALPPR